MLPVMPLVVSLLNTYRVDVEPPAEFNQFILNVRMNQCIIMFVSIIHDRSDQLVHWTIKFNFKRVTPDYLFSIKSGSLCDQHPVPTAIFIKLGKSHRPRLQRELINQSFLVTTIHAEMLAHF